VGKLIGRRQIAYQQLAESRRKFLSQDFVGEKANAGRMPGTIRRLHHSPSAIGS